MIELFEKQEIPQSLLAALKKQNITVPTEIQDKVIPEAVKNKDLIIQSETGTGKTLAYLLPLFKKLNTSVKEMQAIILVPTHELAIQILRQIESLSQNSEIKATSTAIIGNVNIERQIDKLKEKPHIIVGSPGRVLELIKKKKIAAHTVKTIILDEADRLVDDNNIVNVKAIVKSTLKERQMIMCSATITKETEACAKEMMKEPQIIRVTAKMAVPDTIEHISFLTEQRDKIEVLRKLVRIINPKRAIVFVGEREEIEAFTSKLKYHGFSAEGIHSGNIKLNRKKTMDDFRAGRLQLLIASDIAARGLDIDGITHIFNIDIPEDTQDYIHRVGRTGRIGNSGVAISIVTVRELLFIKQYEKDLKIKISPKDMRNGEIVDVYVKK